MSGNFTFYLGTHRPNWLAFMQVPLFISASTIHRIVRERRTFHTHGCGRWAFDSSAYAANSPDTNGNAAHPWQLPPDEYAGMVTRVIDQVSCPPDFAAPQDWPCEPPIREATGFTTRIHQELTLDASIYLEEQFPFVPWARVIQGWETADYIHHLRMHEARGINLADAPVVGLGSVCRRGSARPVIEIVKAIQAYARERYGRQLKLHGFGLNIRALRKIAYLLASSDSLAWSDTARWDHIRLPDCTHQSRYCNNCPNYALTWRTRVLAAVSAPAQPDLWEAA